MTPGFFSFFYVSQTTVGSLASTSAWLIWQIRWQRAVLPASLQSPSWPPIKAHPSTMQMNNCARGKVWTDDPKVAAHS